MYIHIYKYIYTYICESIFVRKKISASMITVSITKLATGKEYIFSGCQLYCSKR